MLGEETNGRERIVSAGGLGWLGVAKRAILSMMERFPTRWEPSRGRESAAVTCSPSFDLDVVIVPDFSGRAATLFEARTLFFLASWLRVYGQPGAIHDTPVLHLCCIGTPPPSVERLAAVVGAEVHRHAVVRDGHPINKLRGLEVRRRGGRLLLLDVDVLVLGDVRRVSSLKADLGAAVAGKAQVPEAAWDEIYPALGIPLPTTRLVSVYGRAGLDTSQLQHRHASLEGENTAMLPYYNSGVVMVSDGCPLLEAWQDARRRLVAYVGDHETWRDHHVLNTNDQPSFALAVAELVQQGFTFAQLPDGANARLPHFRGGLLRLGDVVIFHATGFAAELVEPNRSRDDLPELVRAYGITWADAFRQGASSLPNRWLAWRDGRRAIRLLDELWHETVRDAWNG